MFAAKEAFYKCQYPLTLEWVDFHDVEVRLVNGGGTQCGFELQPRRRLQLQQLYDGPLTGRYRVHAGLVTAGIALC
jgi:4'-phosphopantetheinyl transferase EntD